eukprot:gene3462-17272_t
MRYPDLRDWYAPDRELTPPRREDPSDIGLSCGEVASAYCVDTSAIGHPGKHAKVSHVAPKGTNPAGKTLPLPAAPKIGVTELALLPAPSLSKAIAATMAMPQYPDKSPIAHVAAPPTGGKH